MEETNSLTDRVEKIIKAPIFPRLSITELIDKAFSSSELSFFFDQLDNYPNYKYFIFLHQFDIFGFNTELKTPFLFFCDLPKKKFKKVAGSQALQHIISTEYFDLSMIGSDTKKFLTTMFGIDEKKTKHLEEDVLDIFAYYCLYLIRENPLIKQLVLTEEFNYKTMKSVLKDYKNLELTTNLPEGSDWIDPVIKSKTEKLVLELVSSIVKNFEGFIDTTNKAIPNLYLNFHLSSRLWLSNLLRKTGRQFRDYQEFLDTLYRYQLIENKSTISWCENCSLDNPLYAQYQGRIAPSKIAKFKCVNCNKKQSYGTIFALKDNLKEIMLAKDGLLSVYFGWILRRQKIPFEAGKFLKERETDFLIKNSILVECKMFKLEKDSNAIHSEIINGLAQINKQLKELIANKIKIKKIYLLWNRFEDVEEILKGVRVKYVHLFTKYNLKVINPMDIEKTIEEIHQI